MLFCARDCFYDIVLIKIDVKVYYISLINDVMWDTSIFVGGQWINW